jgi:hypothetical protein
MQGGGAGNNAAGFAAVWVALLLIGVTVMGTLIMRKVIRNSFNHFHLSTFSSSFNFDTIYSFSNSCKVD